MCSVWMFYSIIFSVLCMEEVVFIPKIPIIHSAVTRKYTGQRFTIRAVFAMAVNIAQGQVLILRLIGLLVNNYMWRVLGLQVR